MDQYGWTLAAQGIRTTTRIARPADTRVSSSPTVPCAGMIPSPIHGISLPIRSPHGSPGRLGGDLLVLKSVDGIGCRETPRTHRKTRNKPMSSIPAFFPTCSNTGSGHSILNGTDTPRICRWLCGGAGLRHRALVQPFKGTKRDTIGILKGAISCQIKSVHPAALRLQKRAQQSFACPACGVEITRCYRCREQSIPYVCPKCGFGGP